MKITITIDVPEDVALELVPQGSLGTYGKGVVKAKVRGRLLIAGPMRWLPVTCQEGGESLEAELTRELTPAERKAKRDAEYFDQEFS